MKREELERLAREICFQDNGGNVILDKRYHDGPGYKAGYCPLCDNVLAALERAVAEEREACALLVERGSFLHAEAPDLAWARNRAAAIRSRSGESK